MDVDGRESSQAMKGHEYSMDQERVAASVVSCFRSMADQSELVTVFRSAYESAEEDAKAIGEVLSVQGIVPAILDDSAAGVPEGAWEVRVAAGQVARAEQLISEMKLPEDDLVEVDDSAAFDAETVFRASGGTTQELEAAAVRSVIESAGIATVTVGDPVLPNLSFEIRVAKEHAAQARQLIAEAQAAGPAAAEAAERATECT
jgi:hypothetical protein